MEKEWVGSKKSIILVAILVTLSVISIVAAIIKINKDSSVAPSYNPPDDNQKTETKKTQLIKFENQYQLEYSLGASNSRKVFSHLESLLLSDEEIATAPNPITTKIDANATLDETTFKKAKGIGKTRAYTFNLNVEDGRVYQVFSIADSTNHSYLAAIAHRIDEKSSTTHLYIRMKDKSQETQIIDWAKQVTNLNDFIIEKKVGQDI